MTSWIVTIDKANPQHWAIAVEHGFWDITQSHGLKTGDTAYFWQAGGSFVGQTLVTADARPLASEDEPWEDSGHRAYSHRFEFTLLSDQPLLKPRWTEVADRGHVTPPIRPVVAKTDDPRGETWLRSNFVDTRRPEDLLSEPIRIQLDDLLGTDLRERVLREIAVRRGQQDFRKRLIGAYGGRCAISGYNAESVLEAAHIAPYKGVHTHVVTNGLLLRADLHTLFDLHALTVSPDLKVRVSTELLGTPYGAFQNVGLVVIPPRELRPDRDVLEAHNKACPWF